MQAGKAIAPGAKKVTFFAAGVNGGEKIKFAAGGINSMHADPALTHADTFNATITVTLDKVWTQYEIPLDGLMATEVLGGFSWTVEVSTATPIGFYIDGIRWN
jgi:hypothetical protein